MSFTIFIDVIIIKNISRMYKFNCISSLVLMQFYHNYYKFSFLYILFISTNKLPGGSCNVFAVHSYPQEFASLTRKIYENYTIS